MSISDDMDKISGHEGSFEGDFFLVGSQDGDCPVDGVDGVDIFLQFGHSFEGVIGVVGS